MIVMHSLMYKNSLSEAQNEEVLYAYKTLNSLYLLLLD